LLSKIANKSVLSEQPELKLELDLFNIMFGPFDRLEDNEPFIGKDKKPLGANFYPEDMTKEEFEKWIKDNPADENPSQVNFRLSEEKMESSFQFPTMNTSKKN